MKQKYCITPKQSGLFLLDVCVGLAITVVVLYVFSLAAFQLSEHRSDRKTRQIAVDTLMNINEMLDFDVLKTAGVDSEAFQKQLEPLRETVDRTLPGGKLDVTSLSSVLSKDGENDIMLYRIAVSYDNGVNRPRREFHLLRAFEKIPDDTETAK